MFQFTNVVNPQMPVKSGLEPLLLMALACQDPGLGQLLPTSREAVEKLI